MIINEDSLHHIGCEKEFLKMQNSRLSNFKIYVCGAGNSVTIKEGSLHEILYRREGVTLSLGDSRKELP